MLMIKTEIQRTLQRSSVGQLIKQGCRYGGQKKLANIELDMVADMEVHKVAGIEVDMEADMVADINIDIKINININIHLNIDINMEI